MTGLLDPGTAGPADRTTSRTGSARSGPRGTLAWALWDWGAAAFSAVVTTFVFSTYLGSSLFVDPGVSKDARERALAENAGLIGLALAAAGVAIAVLAPVLGQRADRAGRRRRWLAVNSALVVLVMAGMVFVRADPAFLIFGAILLALGNVFFEFAQVNYNAMLGQVSTPASLGRVSGFGWGLGYLGGIVLLLVLLVLYIQDFGDPRGTGLLGVTPDGGMNIRLAVLTAAVWFAVFALPVLFRVPEIPPAALRQARGVLGSYRALFRTVAELYRNSPRVLMFLTASAVYRDGLAGVFTFGAIIAAQDFGFGTAEVLYFAVAANVVAGVGTIAGGWLDDRIGPKAIIVGSLTGLVVAGSAVLFVGDAKPGFWAAGLFLCLFVGPVQSASRSFLARVIPPGREGELFGLYATTGRAVSFLAPGLFALFAAVSGDTRLGILGVVLLLLAGLLMMLPVRSAPPILD